MYPLKAMTFVALVISATVAHATDQSPSPTPPAAADPAFRDAARRPGGHLNADAASHDTTLHFHAATVTYPQYTFRDGETLADLHLHYATLGQPHKAANGQVDNAVLMLAWTGASSEDLLSDEFRTALFAPGAPFDTSRYFVIIPDPIGQGGSSKPSDGRKMTFPRYGYGDMVDLQHKLVTETLGVPHLRAVVGTSMGCMNAWQWAEAYPSTMDGVMPVACFPSPVAGRNLLWRKLAVDTIESDPTWKDGDYAQTPPSMVTSIQLVRMMIDGVPHLQTEFGPGPGMDKLLGGIRKAVVGHVDANDFIYSLQASNDYNAENDLRKVTARVFAVNFDDDEFYPDSLGILERDMPQVAQGHFTVRPTDSTSSGHLAMEHPALWADEARQFMTWLDTH